MARNYRYSAHDWQNCLLHFEESSRRKPSQELLKAARKVLVEGADVMTQAAEIDVLRTNLANAVTRCEKILDQNGARRLYPVQAWVPEQNRKAVQTLVEQYRGVADSD